MENKRLLVCDMDNTLYDWVGYFVPSFYAMIDKATAITGCNREQLLDEMRAVHQKYGDSEQPFALLETETIRKIYKEQSAIITARVLDPAFHAFNSARKNSLKLHPQVRETLDALRMSGIRLVAHTESRFYSVIDRLKRLELSDYFVKIYCRRRSPSLHPDYAQRNSWLDGFPLDKIVELPNYESKPNPAVLLEICADEGLATDGVAYIGDSVARDVMMAKRAGVYAIWAAYGAEHNPALYNALVRVSHWTPEEVARERRLSDEAKWIEPDYVAHSFSDVLAALGIESVPELK